MSMNWIDEPTLKRTLIEHFIGAGDTVGPDPWDMFTSPPMNGGSQVTIQPEAIGGLMRAVSPRESVPELIRRRLAEVTHKQMRWGGHINSDKERLVFSALDGRPVFPRDLFTLASRYRKHRILSYSDIYKYGFTRMDGFLGSGMSGGDGQPLFANQHPLYSGATAYFDNLLANAPLNEDNLLAMFDLVDAAVDADGVPLGISIDTLWCGPMNERKALQLTGTDRVPETGNNAINAKFVNLKPKILPGLIGTDYAYNWGLSSSMGEREAIVRSQAQDLMIVGDIPDKTTGVLILSADSIEGVAIGHPFWVFGCPATTRA